MVGGGGVVAWPELGARTPVVGAAACRTHWPFTHFHLPRYVTSSSPSSKISVLPNGPGDVHELTLVTQTDPFAQTVTAALAEEAAPSDTASAATAVTKTRAVTVRAFLNMSGSLARGFVTARI